MADIITVLIASAQLAERERLKKQLAGFSDIEVIGEVETDRECTDLASRQRPNVLLIQENLPTLGAFGVTEQITKQASDVGVILLLSGAADEETWHKILRAGIRGFVTAKTPAETLLDEVRRVAAATRKAPSASSDEGKAPTKSQVISVVAPRGGTGKTVIATNLAVALAKKNPRVTLLDFNTAGGDVALMLDLIPKRTLADLLTSFSGIDEDVMESLILKHRSGLFVLPAPLTGGYEMPALSRAVVQSVLKFMRDRCSFTVVDTGHPSFEATLTAMDSSDAIVVVLGQDLPRLRDAKQYLSNLLAANYPRERIRVVANRNGLAKGIAPGQVESIIEFPITARLPNDEELVGDSVNLGQPLVISSPNKALAQAMVKLAESLTNPVEPEVLKPKSKFKLFS